MKSTPTYELNGFFTKKNISTRYPKKKLYASGITCDRKAVIEMNETYTEEQDGIMPFYSEQGNALEKVIQNKYREQNILLASNLNVNFIEFDKRYSLNTGVEIDGLIVKNGTPVLIEIKTVSGIPLEIEYHNKTQLAFYMALFGFDSYIIYQSREVRNRYGLQQKQFYSKYSDNQDYIYSETLKMFRADEYHKESKLPKLINSKEHKEKYCKGRYCPFFSHCFGRKDMSDLVKNLEIEYTSNKGILKRAKERTEHFLSEEEIQYRREMLCKKLL